MKGLAIMTWAALALAVTGARADESAQPTSDFRRVLIRQHGALTALATVRDSQAGLTEEARTTTYVRGILQHAQDNGRRRFQAYREARAARERAARRQARFLYELGRGGLVRLAFAEDREDTHRRFRRAHAIRWLIDHDVHELGVHRRAEARARSELRLAANELQGLATMGWAQGLRAAAMQALNSELETRLLELDQAHLAQPAQGLHPRDDETRKLAAKIATLRRQLERGPRHPLLARAGFAYPVRGHLVGRFGRDREPEAGLALPRQGVELSVGRKTLVRVAAPGRVAYVGNLPGHGRGVVVDHGGGFRSLTAPLGTVEVVEGQTLPEGAVLGRAPLRRTSQGRLYFELRHGERPIDPTPYFGARSRWDRAALVR